MSLRLHQLAAVEAPADLRDLELKSQQVHKMNGLINSLSKHAVYFLLRKKNESSNNMVELFIVC